MPRIEGTKVRVRMKDHNYFVYIATNPLRTVLYIGVTNDLLVRMIQHFENKGLKNICGSLLLL